MGDSLFSQKKDPILSFYKKLTVLQTSKSFGSRSGGATFSLVMVRSTVGGLMILVKEKFDCDIEERQEDEQGRFIVLFLSIFIPQIRPKINASSLRKFKNNSIN